LATYYGEDLAYVHATGFGRFAQGAGTHLLSCLRELQIPVNRVVDIGCGAGVTTRIFSQAGFSVLGVEPSAALIEHARKAAPKAEFIHASAYDVVLPDCAAILAVGEALTYHDDPSAADNLLRKFFRAAHTALAPGGLLAFDVIITGEPDISGKTWVSGKDWAVLVEVIEDQSNRVLTRQIEVFRAQSALYRRSCERHLVRLFDPVDLRAWLADLDFEVEIRDAYGNYRLLPRRIAVTARRT
jgi:SAM-dependent methyltransferase